MKLIIFRKEKIDSDLGALNIGTRGDGSLVSFIGMVRNFSRDREVLKIEYEIFESMAGLEIERIIDQAILNWKITDCTVIHRSGTVFPGEASILIALTTPHRKESFRALEFIIDEIKLRVPIWKKEFYADGSEWISEKS